MGIKLKPNGGYLVDIRDEFNTRKEKTFKTKAEAKAYEATIEKKKYDNKLIASNLQSKRYILEKELEHFELTKSDLRPGSKKRYKYIISQIRDFAQGIGVTYLDEFTPDNASLFKEILMKEKIDPKGNTKKVLRAKPKTINFFLSTMKAFFQQEFIKGHISKNPMIHIKNVKVEKQKADYYKVPELKAFFAQPMDIAYRQTFMGLLLTGMRFSEMANLKWSSVNLTSRTIYVHSDGDFITKTHNGERIIPIGVDLFRLLRSMEKSKTKNELVFYSPKGNKVRERSLLWKCKSIATDAGITGKANLHKFRHTFATLLILNGVSIQNIKELLGHASIAQTEIYAHNKSDHLHPDVARLDHLLK
jgi:integrase/recombinase XerD